MNKCAITLFLTALMCTWSGTLAAQCEVVLHQDSPPGGRSIVIRQSEFPYGIGTTFWEPENTWEKSWNRATGVITDALQGDFDTQDLLWAGGFALHMKKSVLNEVSQNTIGYRASGLVYGNLIMKIDTAGNVLGIDTGTTLLTPKGLYNHFYPGDWGPTHWNDEVSSVSFHGACNGAVITIYRDKEFGGPSLTLSGPATRHLPDHGWNDTLSSFKVSFPANIASGDYALQAHDGRPVSVLGDGRLVADGAGSRFYVHNRGREYAMGGPSSWLSADAYGIGATAVNGDNLEQHFYLTSARDGMVGIMTKAGYWAFTDNNIGGQLSVNLGKIHNWWPFRLMGPLVDIPSGYYVVEAYDGRPVTVQGDSNRSLVAASGSHTPFYVHNFGNGAYTIQGNGSWLNADAGGLHANASNFIKPEQRFYLTDRGDGTVALRTSDGAWTFTDDNIGGKLNINVGWVNNWWSFRLKPTSPPPLVRFGHAVYLKSAHGTYLSAKPDSAFQADAPANGDWETFGMNAFANLPRTEIHFGDVVALTTRHATYVTAAQGAGATAGATTPGVGEQFQLVRPDAESSTNPIECGDQVAFKAHGKYYLVAESDGNANANREGIGSWERFTVECHPADM